MEMTKERPTFADTAHELYRANIELLGWAHAILNAESPEDGEAALLAVGDRLTTWPRRAAKEIQRLRARIEELEREREHAIAINAELRAMAEASRNNASHQSREREALTSQLAAAREAAKVVEAHHHFFDDVGSYHIEISHGGTVAFRELLAALAAMEKETP